jgi:plastocyanin
MKKIVAIVVVAVLVVAGIILLTNKSSDKSSTSSNTTTSQTDNMNEPSSSTQEAAPVTSDTVAIADMAFSPANITVKKGTAVTWTNNDTVGHDVTETDGKDGPKSSTLSKGESYSFTYTTVGTFKYHCSIHPDMTGTVTVTE